MKDTQPTGETPVKNDELPSGDGQSPADADTVSQPPEAPSDTNVEEEKGGEEAAQ